MCVDNRRQKNLKNLKMTFFLNCKGKNVRKLCLKV